MWPWQMRGLRVIEDVFASQAAIREGGGVASAQPRTRSGGEGAKTNYCDCLSNAPLTLLLQLHGKGEEKIGARGRGSSGRVSRMGEKNS